MTNFKESSCRLAIVSAVSGRLRLRALNPDTKASLNAIAQQVKEISGIKEAGVNLETGSLTVIFEPSELNNCQ